MSFSAKFKSSAVVVGHTDVTISFRGHYTLYGVLYIVRLWWSIMSARVFSTPKHIRGIKCAICG